MSIWEYADKVRDQEAVKAGVELLDCPFCNSKLDTLKEGVDRSTSAPGNEYEHRTFRVRACPVCGWWNAYDRMDSKFGHISSTVVLGAAARLRSLDLLDLALPVEEVRSYLAAKYQARFHIHPRLFEETVASVFRSHGYCAEVTAYSNDGGIDVVLQGATGEQVGVQVKRSKNSIAVEQIRSFAGALWLKGHTRGIFVTTSKFQRGATPAASTAALRGIPIELVDAGRFLDALRIAQREMYRSKSDPAAPFGYDSLAVLSQHRFNQIGRSRVLRRRGAQFRRDS